MRKTLMGLFLVGAVLVSAFAVVLFVLQQDGVQALSAPDITLAGTFANAPVGTAGHQFTGTPITVRPEPLGGYLPNPGIGWQHMVGNNDQLLPESVLYPPRQDISWYVLNPAEDVYDWAALDRWIEQAEQTGKQIAFRVYTMRGEIFGGHQMPQWVLDQGAELLRTGEPDYSNCTYQAAWATFVEALRERYDGDPRIAFIDISGYGNFNEWSWEDSQTEWDRNALKPRTLDGQARKRLADMFIGGEDDEHECRTADGDEEEVAYDYPGFEQTQLVMPFAGIRQSIEYVVSQRDDVGIRFDCLGHPDLSESLLETIGEQLDAVWPNAPIVYEFCSGTLSDRDMVEASELVLRTTHASLVHDNLVNPRPVAPAEDLMQLVGYRYMLDSATFPPTIAPGERIPVLMEWQNTGRAPAYPSMGQDFELHVAVVAQNGVIAHDQVVETTVTDWMPTAYSGDLDGADTSGESNLEPPVYTVMALLEPADALRAGQYTLRVSIIDRRTGRPLNLAFEGGDANGWYVVGTIDVTSDGS